MAGHTVYIREKKTKAGKKGVQWPEKKRLETVTTYLATGSNVMTSAMTGVPTDTIEYWKRQPWWKKYIEELQYQDNLQIDAKLTKIMDKSFDAVLDRLENGDVMYDPRTGKHVRIPAKLRDVHKITNDAIEKKQLLRKVASQSENKQTTSVTADHLVEIAKAFAQMAQGKTPHPKEMVTEIIEGEYEEHFEELGYAIHDKRPEGLQEGTSVGAQEET